VLIEVVTIFPEYLAPAREALLGRAIERNLITFTVYDLRDWAHDVHRTVDDAGARRWTRYSWTRYSLANQHHG